MDKILLPTLTRILEPHAALWLISQEKMDAISEPATRLGLTPERLRSLAEGGESVWVQPSTGDIWNISRHSISTLPQLNLLMLQTQDPFSNMPDHLNMLKMWSVFATSWRFGQMTSGEDNQSGWEEFSRICAEPITPTAQTCVEALQLLQEAVGQLQEGRQMGSRLNLELDDANTRYWVDMDISAMTQACEAILRNGKETNIGSMQAQAALIHAVTPYLEIRITHSHTGEKIDWPDRMGAPFITNKPGHHGLGLARVFRIMTLHEGTLSWTITPYGMATTFRFPVHSKTQ